MIDFSFHYMSFFSSAPRRICLKTEEKSQRLPLVLFDSLSIEISTLNSSGGVEEFIAKNTFFLTEKNISEYTLSLDKDCFDLLILSICYICTSLSLDLCGPYTFLHPHPNQCLWGGRGSARYPKTF